MAPLALAFAVLDLTGSASDVGYVSAAYVVPLVAFMLVGGVFADRLPRRAVMLVADVARFGTQGVSAALLISGRAHVWELIALQATAGTAAAFFWPAGMGLTPMTVSPERLQEANGLRSMGSAGSGIAGPVLAGLLVAGVGPGWALATDAASFAVSALFLAGLKLPAHLKLPAQSFVGDMRDGWREFRSRTWVWTIVLSATIGNGVSSVGYVLGPYVAQHSLGGAGAWATIRAAGGVGAVVGALAVLRFRPRRPLLIGTLALLPFAIPNALLGLTAPTAAIAAASVVGFAGVMFFNTLWETTLQQKVPRSALSRVSAYEAFGSLAARPVGLALAGPIAVALSVRSTLIGAAAIQLISMLLIFAVPSVRKLEADQPPPSGLVAAA